MILIDIIQIIISFLLGFAAVWAACAANRLSKKTIELTKTTSQTENKIAMQQEIFNIYKFFSEIGQEDYFNIDNKEFNLKGKHILRLNDIRSKVSFIFNENTSNQLNSLFDSIYKALFLDIYPDYNINELPTYLQKMIKKLSSEEEKEKLVFSFKITEDAKEILKPYMLHL